SFAIAGLGFFLKLWLGGFAGAGVAFEIGFVVAAVPADSALGEATGATCEPIFGASPLPLLAALFQCFVRAHFLLFFAAGLIVGCATGLVAGERTDVFFGTTSWLISAAGFTPAATAAFAAATESGGCFTAPRRSGFTMICRS